MLASYRLAGCRSFVGVKVFSEVFSGGRVGTVSNCTALPCLGRRSASCICTLRCCCQYEVRFHGSRGPQSEYTGRLGGEQECVCILLCYVVMVNKNTIITQLPCAFPLDLCCFGGARSQTWKSTTDGKSVCVCITASKHQNPQIY